ncbi:DUF4238 domain-containing protein [Salegentibacter sp. Hel_I_6]|uniref:DUF4238 domain-containing protein n=1 Tax=Salegentibacter sp. Hel_I_6 TaxID=1250278 RepID=UPI00055AEC5E|nr:DUF4238 domain-containing protein [Salegentibacter sp. Hel_I_6]
MAENLVKRQHFVPRTYLKHFGEKQGQDYFLNVLKADSTDKGDIFKANIKNIALEKDLYTLPGVTVQQKMAIEKFYSDEIETHYDTIYGILTNPEKSEITDRERRLIISTVVTMYYRTTKWVNASRDLMGRAFKMAFQLCERTGSDTFQFDGIELSIKGKTLEEFTKDFNNKRQPGMVMTQLEVALNLIELRIKSDTISVIKINKENLKLVTSDNPVIATNNPENKRFMPFDTSNILKLPLDSKHILMLMPDCPKDLQNRVFRRISTSPFAELEKLTSTHSQMANSERFMFGSKTALESYLDLKEESERPLKDGEKMKDVFSNLRDLGL